MTRHNNRLFTKIILKKYGVGAINLGLVAGEPLIIGTDSIWGRQDEFPRYQVKISAFYMDQHKVTNAQFRFFVEAIHYVTTTVKSRAGKS